MCADVVGERWSLLIVPDAPLGVSRIRGFRARNERTTVGEDPFVGPSSTTDSPGDRKERHLNVDNRQLPRPPR